MAKIYRYTVEVRHGTRGEMCLSGQHVQTDVAVGDTEISASSLLQELDEHFSTSGRLLQLWRNVLDPASVLVRTHVREEVDPAGSDVPDAAEFIHNLVGLQNALPVDVMPPPVCVYFTLKTGVAKRYARGGTHSPPMAYPAALDGAGTMDTANATFWPNYTALAAKLADHLEDTFGTTGNSDINKVIYSRTRRTRGQSPFTFKVTSCTPQVQLRWLRRRMTAP